ncbi:MAG TPA: isoprenylcysteine carboxylmethyltransferase family protein [Granulicella sp.]
MGPHWFHHPTTITIWYATFAFWFIPEIILSRRRPGKDARKADRRSKIIVITAVNLGILLGFTAAFQAPGFSIGIHWETWFVAGIAVWLGGILFRWYSILTLGRFFTFDVAFSSNQHVVERGPYRWLRHPSYLGSLLAMIGFGMTFANWLALILPVCCLAAAYAYRIPVEEQALVQYLGSDYDDYMQRTWRVIPYLF